MTEMEQLYLDDLQVGQRFTSGNYVMEAARIKEFAAEFDPQPFHLEEAAAEASVFKGLAASGWHNCRGGHAPPRYWWSALRKRHRRLGRRDRMAEAHSTGRHFTRRK